MLWRNTIRLSDWTDDYCTMPNTRACEREGLGSHEGPSKNVSGSWVTERAQHWRWLAMQAYEGSLGKSTDHWLLSRCRLILCTWAHAVKSINVWALFLNGTPSPAS